MLDDCRIAHGVRSSSGFLLPYKEQRPPLAVSLRPQPDADLLSFGRDLRIMQTFGQRPLRILKAICLVEAR